MKVLCTCLPGSGHFLPMLPQARALADAGHDVAFATAGEFGPAIEKYGFATFPAGISLAEQLEVAGRKYPEAQLAPSQVRFETFVPRMLAGVAAPSRAAALVEITGDWRPDLIVHDETEFAAPIAAARFGLPYADQSVGILRPLAMARLAGQVLEPLAAEFGVDPGPFGGLFRYLYLDVCPPGLQSAEIDQIAVAHRVHNLTLGLTPGAELPPSLADLPDQPTVYVSLGTIFNRDKSIFEAILAGLHDEPINVIVTVGNNNDPAAFGPQPDHIKVERFIPQAVLLPHCDAVINQGGTAILDILGCGLPILVLPQSANQFHNAAACVARGVGRALLPGEVTPGAVRDGLSALLTAGSYRRRAQQIQAELAAMPGPDAGVHLLERLHQEKAPLRGTETPAPGPGR